MQLFIQVTGKGSIRKIVVMPSDADTTADSDKSEAPNSKLDLYDDGTGLQHQTLVAESWEKGSEGVEESEVLPSIDNKRPDDTGPKPDPITDRDVKYEFPRGEYADDVGLFVENLLAHGYVLVRDRIGFSIDYPVHTSGFRVTVGWIAPPGELTGPGARDITLGVWNHQNQVPQMVTKHIEQFLVAYTGFMGEFAPIGPDAHGVTLSPQRFVECQWDADTLLSGLAHELMEMGESGRLGR